MGEVVGTESTLTVGPITKWSGFYCTVSDGSGAETEVEFQVMVENHFHATVAGSARPGGEYHVDEGATLTLAVGVKGDDLTGVSYQWYGNHYEPIAGAEGSSLEIGPIAGQDFYFCEARDRFGNWETVNFNIYVENNLAAYQSGTKAIDVELPVEPNATPTLSVDVFGTDLTGAVYSWGNDEWLPLNGQTTLSMVLAPVTAPVNIMFEIKDRFGNWAGVEFSVYVENHFSAWATENGSGVANLTVAAGGDLTLEVTADGDDLSGVTYRWVDSDTWTPIVGADGPALALTSIRRAASYACEVSDRYGNVRNVNFAIEVQNHFNATVAGTTKNHAEPVVKPGGSVTLAVAVSGDDLDGVRYQWFDDYGLLEGLEAASITVGPLNRTDFYRCEVTDRYGNVKPVYFNIGIENGFSAYVNGTTSDEIEYRVAPGTSLTLRIKSTVKSGKLTYEWGRYLYDNNGYYVGYEQLDYTGYALATGPVDMHMRYYCDVTDQYGNRAYITFNIRIDTGLTLNNPSQAFTVPFGERAELTADASVKLGGLRYQWYKITYDAAGGQGVRRLQGQTERTLVLDSVTVAGEYICDVIDDYGNVETAYIAISPENHLTAYVYGTQTDLQSRTVRLGSVQQLGVTATADEGDLTYKWYKMTYLNDVDDWYVQTQLGNQNDIFVSPSDINLHECSAFCTSDPIEGKVGYLCVVTDMYGARAYVTFQFNFVSVSQMTTAPKSVTNTATGVTITWNEYEAADQIVIYRKVGTAKSWSKYKTLGGDATTFVDTGVKAGTKYSYTIQILSGIEKSKYHATGKAVTYYPAPKVSSAVSDLTGVTIKWAKTTGAGKYRVFRSTDNATWTKLGDTTAVTFTDKKAVSGNKYYYCVQALSSKGAVLSGYGTSRAINYVGTPKVPALSLAANGITVKWSAVNGATKYNVYRKVGTAKSWTKYKTITDATSFVDTSVKTGTKYAYTIQAIGGTTSKYNTTGKTITYYQAPKSVTATGNPGAVTVKWAKVSGAAKYRVFRRVEGGGWSKLGDTTAVSFKDKTAQGGVRYEYAVRTLNAKGSFLSTYSLPAVFVSYPYVGVRVATVTEEEIAAGIPAGAEITEVIAGSPAEGCTLQAGDVIVELKTATAADWTNVTTAEEYYAVLLTAAPEEELMLKAVRPGAGDINCILVLGKYARP